MTVLGAIVKTSQETNLRQKTPLFRVFRTCTLTTKKHPEDAKHKKVVCHQG